VAARSEYQSPPAACSDKSSEGMIFKQHGNSASVGQSSCNYCLVQGWSADGCNALQMIVSGTAVHHSGRLQLHTTPPSQKFYQI
jgi:hypothetical protein